MGYKSQYCMLLSRYTTKRMLKMNIGVFRAVFSLTHHSRIVYNSHLGFKIESAKREAHYSNRQHCKLTKIP